MSSISPTLLERFSRTVQGRAGQDRTAKVNCRPLVRVARGPSRWRRVPIALQTPPLCMNCMCRIVNLVSVQDFPLSSVGVGDNEGPRTWRVLSKRETHGEDGGWMSLSPPRSTSDRLALSLAGFLATSSTLLSVITACLGPPWRADMERGVISLTHASPSILHLVPKPRPCRQLAAFRGC